MRQLRITNPAARSSSLPFSPGLIAGPFAFISGQVGVDPTTGQLAGPDVQSQTRQALENLRALLEQAGLGMGDVVKTTVFLTRMEDFAAMNEVYQSFFPEPLPARSTVGVAALARPELLVEIEAIALRSA
jgi:2-iminobutanoate/2-iminopropanoate deaminase